MRLVHLAEYTNHYDASFNRALSAVLLRAAARGFEPEAGFPAEAGGAPWIEELERAGVTVHLLRARGRRARAAELQEILGAPGPLLVHTHFTTFDLAAAMATSGRPETIRFWHVHTVLRQGSVGAARNVLKLTPYRSRIDRIICPASNIRDGLIRRGARADRTIVLPSPVDAEAYRPLRGAIREQTRALLGLTPSTAALLHFGRDWEIKGGDFFAAALAELHARGVEVVGLSLQGGEPAQAAAEGLGLEGVLRPLERAESLPELYSAVDCLMAPSRGEGMPFTVVEALASGVPVVASDLPGHRFVGDEVEACAIVPSDPISMADGAAAFLARSPEVAAEQAGAARRWIVENLDPVVVADRLVDEYMTVAAERGIAVDD